jgi:hypothetical protein
VPGHPVAERVGNLEAAGDAEPGTDHGARGGFDDRAHGVLDRGFLCSLGHVGREVLSSVADRVHEVRSGAVG